MPDTQVQRIDGGKRAGPRLDEVLPGRDDAGGARVQHGRGARRDESAARAHRAEAHLPLGQPLVRAVVVVHAQRRASTLRTTPRT